MSTKDLGEVRRKRSDLVMQARVQLMLAHDLCQADLGWVLLALHNQLARAVPLLSPVGDYALLRDTLRNACTMVRLVYTALAAAKQTKRLGAVRLSLNTARQLLQEALDLVRQEWWEVKDAADG